LEGSFFPTSLCGVLVFGCALPSPPPAALGWLWWRAWFSVDAVDAAALCVAGVALGVIDHHFAWQAWGLATWTCILRGRRGTYGTGLALVARLPTQVWQDSGCEDGRASEDKKTWDNPTKCGQWFELNFANNNHKSWGVQTHEQRQQDYTDHGLASRTIDRLTDRAEAIQQGRGQDKVRTASHMGIVTLRLEPNTSPRKPPELPQAMDITGHEADRSSC